MHCKQCKQKEWLIFVNLDCPDNNFDQIVIFQKSIELI